MSPTYVTAYAANPIRQALEQYLEADTALMALLTGGVFDADDLPQEGMGQGWVPRLPDSPRIAPFCVVAWKSTNRFGQFQLRAGVQTLEIYVYQDTGYDTIKQATTRLIELLDDSYWTVSDQSKTHFEWTTTGPETMDDGLADAPLQFVRFEVKSTPKMQE